MRIALVDHRVSAGGVSRFLYALLSHLAMAHPEDEFVLLSTRQAIDRDGLLAMFSSLPNVAVEVLPRPTDVAEEHEAQAIARGRTRGLRRLIDVIKRSRVAYDAAMRAYQWFGERFLGRKLPWYRFWYTEDAIAMLNGFDVVYFAWPYYMASAHLEVATVGTFHDLHYKHFPESYNPEMLRVLEHDVGEWLRTVSAVVVSTHFIASDVQRYYLGATSHINVIHLAPYAAEVLEDEVVRRVQQTHRLPQRYMIYSGGRPRHKNIIVLLKALSELKAAGTDISLVLTGIGTEIIGDPNAAVPEGDAASELNRYLTESGLSVGTDVIPLGYVSNRDVDALTQGATIVVSASLYEAGCGPAMDAWRWGVPVAFSDIPPFVEQLEVLGTTAWVFDPLDPSDVADKIRAILADPAATELATRTSQEAIGRYTWDDVAAKYYSVFQEALESRAREGGISGGIEAGRDTRAGE